MELLWCTVGLLVTLAAVGVNGQAPTDPPYADAGTPPPADFGCTVSFDAADLTSMDNRYYYFIGRYLYVVNKIGGASVGPRRIVDYFSGLTLPVVAAFSIGPLKPSMFIIDSAPAGSELKVYKFSSSTPYPRNVNFSSSVAAIFPSSGMIPTPITAVLSAQTPAKVWFFGTSSGTQATSYSYNTAAASFAAIFTNPTLVTRGYQTAVITAASMWYNATSGVNQYFLYDNMQKVVQVDTMLALKYGPVALSDCSSTIPNEMKGCCNPNAPPTSPAPAVTTTNAAQTTPPQPPVTTPQPTTTPQQPPVSTTAPAQPLDTTTAPPQPPASTTAPSQPPVTTAVADTTATTPSPPPSVSTATPPTTVSGPPVSTATPPTTVSGPPVSTATPPTTVSGPPVSTDTPPTTVSGPPVSTATPPTTVSGPPVSTATPPTTVSGPPVSTDTPPTTVSGPPVSTATPPTTVSGPPVSTDTPPTTVSGPPVSTDTPPTTVSGPPVSTATPPTTVSGPPVSTDTPPTTVSGPPVSTATPPTTVSGPPVSTDTPPTTVSGPPVSTATPPTTVSGPPVSTATPPTTVSGPPVSTDTPPTTVSGPPVSTATPPTTVSGPPVSTDTPPTTVSGPPVITDTPPTTVSGPPVITGTPPTTVSGPPVSTDTPPTTVSGPPVSTDTPPTTVSGPPVITGTPPTTVSGPPVITATPPTTVSGPPVITATPPPTTTPGVCSSRDSTYVPPANCSTAAPGSLAFPYTSTATTDTEKMEILTVHNNDRRTANANNMLALTWDDCAASNAQAWATTCPSGSDSPPRNEPGFAQCGQNIALATSATTWTNVVQQWFGEVSQYNNQDCTQNNAAVGHYTQVMWAVTGKIGCGVKRGCTITFNTVTYNNVDVYVCNYCTAGNVNNGDGMVFCPYPNRGAPCSQCPTNTACASGDCLCA